MRQSLQNQTISLLSELLDLFNFNRKLVLFNGLLISIVVFIGLMNHANTRETNTTAERIQRLLQKMHGRQAGRATVERAQARAQPHEHDRLDSPDDATQDFSGPPEGL